MRAPTYTTSKPANICSAVPLPADAAKPRYAMNLRMAAGPPSSSARGLTTQASSFNGTAMSSAQFDQKHSQMSEKYMGKSANRNKFNEIHAIAGD